MNSIFVVATFFSNGKDVSDKSLYTQLYIYLFLYIRMFSKNLSRNVTRYDLKKLIYIQGKDFCTLLYIYIYIRVISVVSHTKPVRNYFIQNYMFKITIAEHCKLHHIPLILSCVCNSYSVPQDGYSSSLI